MKSGYGKREIPYLYWILGVTVATFVVQGVLSVWMGQKSFVIGWFALSMPHILQGKVWTLLSYALLHASIGHLLFNGFLIFMAGRGLLPLVSHKRILQLYLAAVAVGGLCYLAANFRGDLLVGASAGGLGLLTLYCLLNMDRPITLYLFFVLPLTILPRWLLYLALGVNSLGFLFIELPETFQKAPLELDPTGFSAHLGGMFAGWVFFRYAMSPSFSMPGSRRKINIEPPEWLKRKPRAAKASRGFKLNMSSRSDLKKEVDRILDKINSKGFGSLSEDEKQTLDKARDILKN